jgi:hypothetical protein
MLFLFEKPGTYRFWMKGMRFPIDIVWIRDDEVVGIEHNVPLPAAIPQTYTPPVPVAVVLELPAGDAARRGIEIGSRVLR